MQKNTFDESRLGLRDDLSLSLSTKLFRHKHTTTTTTTTTVQYDDDDDSSEESPLTEEEEEEEEEEERALRFPSCGGLFLSSSCFVLWPVLLLRI